MKVASRVGADSKSAQLLIAFILAVICSSAFAEYKVITKFRTCELVGTGPKSCEDPNAMKGEKQPVGAEPEDIKACEAIADNINEMEKFHVDWNCGFAISANNFLLSKPSMTEVTDNKEKCNAFETQGLPYKSAPNLCDQILRLNHPLYSFSTNLDDKDDIDKVYLNQAYDGTTCLNERHTNHRVSIWTAKNDGTALVSSVGKYSTTKQESDPVLFSSRLYFVEYGRGVTSFTPEFAGKNDFAVYAIRKHRSENHYGFVCVIRSTHQPEPTKE